jgi:MoaA/NifB/PqqE/SkfB family radical SAM enzyme
MTDRHLAAQATPGLPHAYRIPDPEARGDRVASLPLCVFIEVTNRCNLRCATCPRTFVTYEPPRDMTYEEFVALVDQFPSMERAVLHGIGEPLLNRWLSRMIRYLKARQVTVLFNSNGTVLTSELQVALAESGLDEYRLSLDGADAEIYERIRGKPLFDRVVENVRGLVATKKRLGVDAPRLSIWCMGMRENVVQLPGLIRLAADIGIPEVYVQRLTYFMDPSDRQGLSQAEQALYGSIAAREADIIAACAQLSAELGIAFTASGATDPGHSLTAAQAAEQRPWGACRRPWSTAYITANGNALPCCISPFATTHYEELVLGNVWQKSFAEIWDDAPYRAWRKALLSANPHQACSGCGVYWSL